MAAMIRITVNEDNRITVNEDNAPIMLISLIAALMKFSVFIFDFSLVVERLHDFHNIQ